MEKLGKVMDEVEAGLDKLDKGEIWTANSHSLSLLTVSFLLFLLGWLGVFLGLLYFLKVKIYWRLKRKRLLK